MIVLPSWGGAMRCQKSVRRDFFLLLVRMLTHGGSGMQLASRRLPTALLSIKRRIANPPQATSLHYLVFGGGFFYVIDYDGF